MKREDRTLSFVNNRGFTIDLARLRPLLHKTIIKNLHKHKKSSMNEIQFVLRQNQLSFCIQDHYFKLDRYLAPFSIALMVNCSDSKSWWLWYLRGFKRAFTWNIVRSATLQLIKGGSPACIALERSCEQASFCIYVSVNIGNLSTASLSSL